MTRATSTVLGAAALLAVWFAISAAGAAQPSSLVLLDVGVEQPDGLPVNGLERDDFEIVIGGAPQPIQYFAGGERPLALLLLLDVSASMDGVVPRSDVRDAIERFFVPRLAAVDRVRIGAFAKHLFISPELRSDRAPMIAATRRALDPEKADTFGPSPIWDALYTGIGQLATTEGRRAVVLLTDGRATGNRRSADDVAQHAMTHAVTISVVGEDWEMVIRQDGDSGVRIRAGARLQWIASATGGLYLPDRSMQRAPGPLLDAILADLHCRYTLGFEPPVRDGQAREIEVRVKRPDVKVRSRLAYIAAR
jgi:VWFA-related protein